MPMVVCSERVVVERFDDARAPIEGAVDREKLAKKFEEMLQHALPQFGAKSDVGTVITLTTQFTNNLQRVRSPESSLHISKD